VTARHAGRFPARLSAFGTASFQQIRETSSEHGRIKFVPSSKTWVHGAGTVTRGVVHKQKAVIRHSRIGGICNPVHAGGDPDLGPHACQLPRRKRAFHHRAARRGWMYVRNRFGEDVARIVEACSDNLADTAKGERKAHWRERKEAYLAHLRTADEDTLWVSLADKVHNARTIL
jgi:hypothetical protein